jgi:hypothetical protein
MDEAVLEVVGPGLRTLFATLTLQGYPTVLVLTDEDNPIYMQSLTSDYYDQSHSDVTARNRFLQDLERRLREEGKKSIDYGFPPSLATDTELERERLRIDRARSTRELSALERRMPSTPQHNACLDEVKEAVDGLTPDGPPALFLLQGSGGTGKTSAIKKVLAYARSQGKLDMNCASTAVAAAMYMDSGSKFYTAHHLFKLPVVEDDNVEDELPYASRLYEHPEFQELVLSAELIVWDEAFGNSSVHLDAAFDCTNQFMGKVVILVGDIKQMLAISEDNTYESVSNDCIVGSQHFHRFNIGFG